MDKIKISIPVSIDDIIKRNNKILNSEIKLIDASTKLFSWYAVNSNRNSDEYILMSRKYNSVYKDKRTVEFSDEIFEWAEEHGIVMYFDYKNTKRPEIIIFDVFFQNVEDALLFKMTWM